MTRPTLEKKAMRPMSMPALAIFLTMILLTFVRCDKQPNIEPKSAHAAAAAPGAIVLPSFTALVKKEGPAVVNIGITQKARAGRIPFHDFPGLSPNDPIYEFFRRFRPGDQIPREFRSQTTGSGFIVSRDGYILSNAHLVENADEVTVRLTDRREFKAKVVGTDRRSDVALLKIDAHDLPVVSIGDSSKLEVGEWVVAIGSPFGFTNSVSQGIVSAKERSLPGENIVPFIQTDVPINPGNSGGPLFNLNGEVVGVNSQIYSRSGGYMGLSFAIPINLAMKVKDELLQHGAVRRGRLGVSIQDATQEQARSFGLARAGGALVSSVEKDGAAERAGMEIGDIILKFDGKELSSADDLVRAVAETAPGSNIKIQVWRQGATKEMTVKLSEAEKDAAAPKDKPRDREAGTGQLGLTLRELDRDEREDLRTDGFLEVEAVEGIAAESGIRRGDIIIAVNNQRVSSVQQFHAAYKKAGRHVSLLVQRDGGKTFIPLRRKDD